MFSIVDGFTDYGLISLEASDFESFFQHLDHTLDKKSLEQSLVRCFIANLFEERTLDITLDLFNHLKSDFHFGEPALVYFPTLANLGLNFNIFNFFGVNLIFSLFVLIFNFSYFILSFVCCFLLDLVYLSSLMLFNNIFE